MKVRAFKRVERYQQGQVSVPSKKYAESSTNGSDPNPCREYSGCLPFESGMGGLDRNNWIISASSTSLCPQRVMTTSMKDVRSGCENQLLYRSTCLKRAAACFEASCSWITRDREKTMWTKHKRSRGDAFLRPSMTSAIVSRPAAATEETDI